MKTDYREPRAFVIEDDKAKPFEQPKSRVKSGDITFAKEPLDEEQVVVPHTHRESKPAKLKWLAILATALFGLLTMAIGLWVTNLVQSLFLQASWLGWTALALALLAVVAATALIARELWGLWRLQKIEKIQDAVARAINLNDASAGREAIAGFSVLLSDQPEMQLAFKQFAQHQTEIMDPKDRMRLANRILFQPLDTKAHEIISTQAKRVTLLTTITPAAGLDMLFVLALNLSMLRQISTLYGGRPSSLSTLRLARMILTHLAVAGGLALSDTVIQQLIGRGFLGRLSARFGEGAVNGILTTRVGLAAKAVCRPIPSDSPGRDDFVGILKNVITAKTKAGNDAAE